MKFRVGGSSWPVGQHLIPNGTVIDTTGNPEQMNQWSREVLKRGLLPPVDAQPLDDATYQQMVAIYGAHRVATLKT
jgi:hypothetical protein